MTTFSLKRLLELRANRERAVAAQLATAEAAARQAQSAHAVAVRTHESSVAALDTMSRSGASIGEIRSVTTVVSALSAHADVTQATHLAAEDGVRAVEAILVTATQDRRVLERLRERHDLAVRDTETARERAAMDAAALSRYVVAKSGKVA